MHERIAEIASSRLLSHTADEAVAWIAKCGFDTVLISDADRDEAAFAALAAACKSRDLAVWVVVSPDAIGSPMLSAEPADAPLPWLVAGDAALDPRRPPGSVRPGPVDAATFDAAAWNARVDAAIDAGASGLLCRDADRLPTAFWTTQMARVADRPITWAAYTPGLAHAAVAGLVEAGFGLVCNSVAWWDGHSRWLVDEVERLGATRTLAFPIDPFSGDDGGPLSPVARLRAAALVGDAMLVPQILWSDPALANDLGAVNAWLRDHEPPANGRAAGLHLLSGPGAPVTVLVRSATRDLRGSARVQVLLLNPDAHRPARVPGESATSLLGGFGRFGDGSGFAIDPCATLELSPGTARLLDGTRLAPIRRPVPSNRRSTEGALQMPRLAIEAVVPAVNDGRFPVKRTVGDVVRVEADVIIDGHEKLAAALLYRCAGERDWEQVRMEPIGNDRFMGRFPLGRVGRHEYTIEAWRDAFATYRNELDKKAAAGLDVSLELLEGRIIVEQAVAHARTTRRAEVIKRLSSLVKTLYSSDTNAQKVAALLASQTLSDMQDADPRAFAHRLDTIYPLDAERTEASFASWYELFPRSLGNPPGSDATHHGTFADVIDRLPAVRDMGFDVLYFPPIHPIGLRNRKGRNNSLTPTEDDPGSPYAIGSADGGHDALHPQLGTFEDFRRMRDAALEHGLELALDFAIQCSPDHPWLQHHPGWFAWRPDGSLRYAENPPKKYEDIVNVDFYGGEAQRGSRNDPAPALWAALRDVVLLWVDQGVRIFRVDNPHTKPLPFWEWMIGEVRAKHPDVIFLSEAFTRPKVMYRLAKVGFSQSYTYFTWRHTKEEFVEYLTELTGPRSNESLGGPPRDFFRPNFFVNTPDINPVFLQRSGRAGFLIRAALAATLSGLWGVYSGFELCEATPVPGKEDYLDSEKYQLRAWDWRRPGHIIGEITALNRIRKENPVLRTHLNVQFETVFDPNILYFTKATEDRSNVLLVAINLDPFGVHEADFELPLWRWGLADDAGVDATDLLDGHRFRWQGKRQRMRLDPSHNPYAIWRVAVASNPLRT